MKNLSCSLLLLAVASANAQKVSKLKEELILNNPPFPECHASTLIETPGKQVLVAFFGGTEEGNKDVGIWTVSQSATGWNAPVEVANGKQVSGTQYPCWNPVFYRTDKKNLVLYYKVGPNPREWWGLQKTSNDNGKTWSDAVALPEGVLGPIKNKPVSVGKTIISPSSVEFTNKIWKAHVEISQDQGRTWKLFPIDTANPVRVIQPTILVYPGKLQALCRSDRDKILSSWSADQGVTWSKLEPISLDNPNSGIDGVTLKSGWQLLVYNPTVSGKQWSNGRGELAVAMSRDGKNWTKVITLENGNNRNEFSYPAVIQTSDNKIHITYTYNRKNIKHVILQEN
ncbi:Predicted neuraminidase (sialidase) [Chitinophaga terrae (ex Kim and Jung 2007)]|uniref:Predicted neuraminidase (Sialidase) n=1 Tax=Chitinophaga terrae (ex Kim and Jung 2007) TaxID=408074 RepID=A0A1H4FQR2_9BACT|nr:sialidase family protein [Chitinophaga terrae (ex Kim and Jung 2007)]MDQ0109652.1 alpha-L-fucosidase [Chitinophaga terrae (ex Kim and Jung 2007)]SEA99397.1 Predicted neuraminidase (sialidase) [Chitinophaga terrae (ex Kim and Jung 2007)]